jgi:hypothetical protein
MSISRFSCLGLLRSSKDFAEIAEESLALTFELAISDLASVGTGNVVVDGVWHFDSGQAGPKVAITALIHGMRFALPRP